tara:strand:- start:109 stop:393 length:285 start_codon:yes stop_codon:yes gene_type:complete
MRLIEEQMNQAINSKSNWSKDNTEVIYFANSDVSMVFLHGHKIAVFDHYNDEIIADINTLSSWPTRTTKSRLRSLGIDIYTRKGITYLNGREVI